MKQNGLKKEDLFEGLSVAPLKFYGLWYGIADYKNTMKTSNFFKFNMALSIFYVSPFVFFQMLSIFVISVDIKMATFIYLNGMSSAHILIKIFMFVYRFDDQCQLFDLLKVDFLSSIPKRKRSKVNEIYKSIAKRCNVFIVLAFAGNVLTIVTWLIMPGFDTERTGTGRKKVLSGWYPVPYSESPWYEIVFGYEVILLSWHGSLESLYECIFLMPLIGLYAHFLSLGYHVSTLKKPDFGKDDPSGAIRGNAFLNKQLREILMDYEKLLR